MVTPDSPVFRRSSQWKFQRPSPRNLNTSDGPVVHTRWSVEHIGRSGQEAHPVKTVRKLHAPDGPVVYNGRIPEPMVDSAGEKITRCNAENQLLSPNG